MPCAGTHTRSKCKRAISSGVIRRCTTCDYDVCVGCEAERCAGGHDLIAMRVGKR
eukprot:gene2220-4721_t